MPRNLSLNISVGALLDSSMERTFGTARESTRELGQQQRNLNRELTRVRTVQRYEERLRALQRQAQTGRVSTERMNARLAAARERLSAASEEARLMGLNVSNLSGEEERLNRQLERNNRILRARERLARVGAAAKSGAMAAGRGLATAGMWGGSLAGATVAAITASNMENAALANQAQAVGMSNKQMSIWGGIVKQMGFDETAVIDLMEEMNNKIGESEGLGEQITPVIEALQILRLNFEELKALKPDQQFRKIIQAAQKIGTTKASAAADIFMGGEANKIIGYLNSINQPIDDLFKRYERIYIGSVSGIEGAKKYSRSIGDLTFTIGSAFKELSGIIGEQLAPQFQQWANDLADTFKNNKNEIENFAKNIGVTLVKMGQGFTALAKNLPTIVRAMTTLSKMVVNWFGDDEEEKEEEKAVVSQQVRNAGFGGHFRTTYAEPHSFSNILRGAAATKTEPATVNQNNKNDVVINVVQQQGESGSALAERIKGTIDTATHKTISLYESPAIT